MGDSYTHLIHTNFTAIIVSYTDPHTGKFKEGNPGKPKGAISEKTAIWNEIGEWFSGEGIEAYQEELMKMRENAPNEFLKRFEAMLEYFQPKLSRTEFSGNLKTETDFDPSQYTDKELEELERLLSKTDKG